MLQLRMSMGCLMLASILGVATLAYAAEPAGHVATPASGDPFAYCARVGSRDALDGGSSPLSESFRTRLASALGLASDAAIDAGGYYWRCMDGAVYVCAVGANIPCAAKADHAKRNAGAEAYCREIGDAAFVPAFAAGHDTLYAWSCKAGIAQRGKPLGRLDRQGYRVDFWHRLSAGPR
jgi:hypothetical protein